MKALKFMLAGCVAAAALAAAAPAAAQYYPGYPSPYGAMPYGSPYGYANPYGYGSPYGYNGYANGYAGNQQAAVSQCTAAVQARIGNGYRGYGYGGGYGGGRVLGISRIEPRGNGGFTIHGVASTGNVAGYGTTPNSPVDLTFRCRTDFRGLVTSVDINRAQRTYGSTYAPYNPYSPYDYSQYGYRRY